MPGYSHVAVPPEIEKEHPLPDVQTTEHAIETIENLPNKLKDD